MLKNCAIDADSAYAVEYHPAPRRVPEVVRYLVVAGLFALMGNGAALVAVAVPDAWGQVMSDEAPKGIHAAVRQAMRRIGALGIGKTKKNEQQNYHFRGVEDAMNEMNPVLHDAGIIVTPSYSELSITERLKAEGKGLRFVTLKGSFKFESADKSFVVAEAYGEAMDSGDKATIKAMSVSFRTALFQTFVVPYASMDTEFDDYEDADVPQIPAELRAGARTAAGKGSAEFKKFYKAATAEQRTLLDSIEPELRGLINQADAGAKP